MLTDKQIRNAKPKEKPYKLPKELGLFLIVTPADSKWWRFAYSFNGKEKTISLGTYPLISLSIARERRDHARRQVARGVDPSAHRQAQRDAQTEAVANTFGEVVIKLSAMLFQRPGEIRQMQWPQLDLEAQEWRYVVNKTKRHTGTSHIVPLPTQAVEILHELFQLTGHGLGLRPEAPRYVLPDAQETGYSDLQKEIRRRSFPN